jgi:hypothetical protein
MLTIDWVALLLGIALLATAFWLAAKFARDDADAFIHYVYTVALGLGGGLVAVAVPGFFEVKGDFQGMMIRATGGFAVFVFVIVIYYRIRTRKAVARVQVAQAYRARALVEIKTGCKSTDARCNDDPILICTSLPVASSIVPFHAECRVLAEIMCTAVVRSIEEYCRTKTDDGVTSLPAKMKDLYAWAKTPVTAGKPGLPGCLDLSSPSRTLGESMRIDISSMPSTSTPDQIAAARYTNRVYDSVESLGSGMMSFDIDDWNDD